jgi:hypothetical protein
MRIKIIVKTPSQESIDDLKPGQCRAFLGTLAQVVNADTGEPIEGYSHLSLNLDQNQVIHATMTFEPELDIDVEVPVVKNKSLF